MKIETFHGDLRARMKKMRGKYQDFRDRVGKNYLSKFFTFDLETCDDFDNFSKSSSDNDHHRNSFDFEDMYSENEKLGVKVKVEINEYQDEEQNKDGSNFELSVKKIVVEEIIYHKEDDCIPKMKINKKDIAEKRDISQVENDENFFKTLGKSPLSRLMIWDYLKKKAVTYMSENFKEH